MWKYKSRVLQVGRSWTDDNGRQFPANWNRMTRKQKESVGLVWKTVTPPAPYDSRFYYSALNPKPLDDKPAVDEMNQPILDEKGQQVITKGLKTEAVEKVKQTANQLLSDTDWMVIRAQEKGTAIPADVQSYRDGVRAAADTIESAINGAADLEAFIALHKVPTVNGEPSGKAPIENWPDSI